MRLPLNSYALNAGTNPVDALTANSLAFIDLGLWDGSHLEPFDAGSAYLLDAAADGDVLVAVLNRPSSAPAWQRFLADQLGLVGFGGGGPSLGAVVFCAIAEADGAGVRWMAWTFGAGARALRRSRLDARFGLLAALNTFAAARSAASHGVDRSRPQLRALEYLTTTPYFQRTGHRAPDDIPVDAFRFDRHSDLVSKVGARTGDPDIAALTGGRGLSFRTEVGDLKELVRLSEDMLHRSQGTNYRVDFGWIDDLIRVEDLGLLDQLRLRVTDVLVAAPSTRDVEIFLPDMLLNDSTVEYILLPGERRSRASRTTLPADRIGSYLASHGPAGLDHELRFVDTDGVEIASASILECLCADVEHDGAQYVLADGGFYGVSRTFLATLNAEIDEIETSDLEFPLYDGGSEPRYLEKLRTGAASSFIVLDRELVRIDGERAGVEAADLVAATGALVHVKRKESSRTLSHLFLQATNSADLLRHSLPAREQLSTMIDKARGDGRLTAAARAAVARLGEHGYEGEVAFAFLTPTPHRGARNLPLFSKISLVHATRRLRQLRYRPTVAFIGPTA